MLLGDQRNKNSSKKLFLLDHEKIIDFRQRTLTITLKSEP
jgi:hypothetical protein